MKKLLLAMTSALAFAAGVGAGELDTTVSNEFWCTWAYTNKTAVSTNSAELSSAFDSVCQGAGFYEPEEAEKVYCLSWTIHRSAAIAKLNSFPPPGCIMLMR